MTPSARPRLLLIHGLLGSLNYFEPQRYLPGVDVLGPDLIGYGQRYRTNDVFDVGATVTATSRPYDGQRERGLRIVFDLTYRF